MNLVGSDDDNDIVTEGSAFVHNEPAQHDKDLPKVESEMEVLHEKVKKQIIKEGHGQKPPKLSTCFCKCHALLEFLCSSVMQLSKLACYLCKPCSF